MCSSFSSPTTASTYRWPTPPDITCAPSTPLSASHWPPVLPSPCFAPSIADCLKPPNLECSQRLKANQKEKWLSSLMENCGKVDIIKAGRGATKWYFLPFLKWWNAFPQCHCCLFQATYWYSITVLHTTNIVFYDFYTILHRQTSKTQCFTISHILIYLRSRNSRN